MNKIIVLVFLSLFLAGACQIGNGRRMRLPKIEGFAFVGTHSAWIVTQHNDLLRTTDGGQHWRRLQSPIGLKLQEIFFLNETRGWALSENETLVTTIDGGETWRTLFEGFTVKKNFKVTQLSFSSEQLGWIVDASSVWQTSDGGTNWRHVFPIDSIRSTGHYPLRVFDLGIGHWWIGATNGHIYSTKDSGANWKENVLSTNTDFGTVFFVDVEHGWLAGWPNGGIYRTNNKGHDWERVLQQVRDNNVGISSLYFIDKREGWAVGGIWPSDFPDSPTTGAVFHSIDQGSSWQKITVDKDEEWFEQIYFSGNAHGWIISKDRVYRTNDGGATWFRSFE